MLLSKKLKNNKPTLSFEIFPQNPQKGGSPDALLDTVRELKKFNPDFISVTYSAGGGGNKEKTAELAGAVSDMGISSVAHMTCINSSKNEVHSFIEDLKKRNVKNVLALRGDIPEDFNSQNNPDYKYAKDLIKDISGNDICVGAASYPEGHIECEDIGLNIKHLKEKEDAGAEFFISQLFFSNDCFYSFLDEARSNGVKSPMLAGIMPFMSKSQIQRMIFLCGASLPTKIIKLLYKYENDPKGLIQAGIEYAAMQCIDLLENGVDGIHLYTMNKAFVAEEIVKAIGSKIGR